MTNQRHSEMIAAFQALSHQADIVIGEALISFAETVEEPDLTPGEIFMASVLGTMGGALKVLKASVDAGMLIDGQGKFEILLRQTADLWGQLHDETPAGGTVQ